MIDTATIERYMRDTNPIPHTDDLDADEFARFVATTNTRRAAITQAPAHHKPRAYPNTRPALHRHKAWAFAAALSAVVMAIGIPVWLLGGDDPEGVASAPAAVFDLQTDSFCEWFTAEDMNEIVATAQQRAGTAYVLAEFTPGGCDSSWSTPGWPRVDPRTRVPESGNLEVAVWISFLDSPETDHPHRDQMDPNAFVEHHLLDDAISYQNRTYQFAWRDGLDGYLKVDGHEDEIIYFGLSVDDSPAITEMTAEYEDLGLALMNEILQRMNWTDPGE